IRENKILPFLKPDGKTQLTMIYDENGNASYIDSIVVSCHHQCGCAGVPDDELSSMGHHIGEKNEFLFVQ
ncbi:MAG: hypothetical protein Q8754_03030, partial [Sweet potato little leaf phytoplasma]|nr:hypothetical protein [Sweet potato little leaf phytoplasma]